MQDHFFVRSPKSGLLCSGLLLGTLFLGAVGAPSEAQPAGEAPALRPRITQNDLLNLNHRRMRREGMRIFSTPFNLFDGLGDGPIDPLDPVSEGGRPTLGNNGTFLRMNGLDAQTCLECHSILSNATIPAQFAVGGVGTVAQSAFPGIIDPDIDDSEGNGFARIQGRMINPPFSFGSGGVELLGKEMTAELQRQKNRAQQNPGTVVALEAKGVSFGSIVFDNGAFDFSNVEGVGDDLIIRPFGRKGTFAPSIRAFDIGAMQFHHGIQPAEVVGFGVDDDGDGVVNELLPGELSAMHVFQVSLERPWQERLNREARRGRSLFGQIGCSECHIPELRTRTRHLPLSFPEVPEDPSANVYYQVDLASHPPRFRRARGGGVRVPLFADLKMHDMGPGLAESTGADEDAFFTTARLWGVADTAPYLHDGRAVTLSQAILLHGGEGQAARDAFDNLLDDQKEELLAFLRTLRVPRNPNRDLESHHSEIGEEEEELGDEEVFRTDD